MGSDPSVDEKSSKDCTGKRTVISTASAEMFLQAGVSGACKIALIEPKKGQKISS